MACAKIKCMIHMRNFNDNVVQGRLSENYLTQINYILTFAISVVEDRRTTHALSRLQSDQRIIHHRTTVALKGLIRTAYE